MTIFGRDCSDHQPNPDWTNLDFGEIKLYDPANNLYTANFFERMKAQTKAQIIYVTGGPKEDGPDTGKALWSWAKNIIVDSLHIDLSTVGIYADQIEFGMAPAEVKNFIAAVQADNHPCGQYGSEDNYVPSGEDYRNIAHYGQGNNYRPANYIAGRDIFQYDNPSNGDSDLFDGNVDELISIILPKGVIVPELNGSEHDALAFLWGQNRRWKNGANSRPTSYTAGDGQDRTKSAQAGWDCEDKKIKAGGINA